MNIFENTLVFKLQDDNNFSKFNNTKEIKNFIADLSGISIEVAENIKDKFITFASSVTKMNGTFVIVCDFSFDDSLIIVPTLQEAYDYIEMDEMSRQLEF
tara:strand:+ start:854 stop:1153 length:300 start_codon:yes stop_codon:yes gene_type:complete